MELKFRTLRADEIDCRVAQCTSNEYRQGVQLLLYKDARVDMDILDEVVTPLGWKREHTRDNANCIVSIYDTDKKEWVSKEDTGTESNTEKEKGLCSDSFKRACFNWGIGRELYTSPTIFVEWEIEKKTNNGREILKPKYSPTFYVSDIDYDDKRNISLLVIRAKSGKSDKEVFNWKKGYTTPKTSPTNPDSNKPKNIPPKEEKPVTTQNTQSNDMTIEQALNHTINFGVHKGKPFSQIPEDYLKWLADKAQDERDKKAATLALWSINTSKQTFLTELKDDNTEAPF